MTTARAVLVAALLAGCTTDPGITANTGGSGGSSAGGRGGAGGGKGGNGGSGMAPDPIPSGGAGGTAGGGPAPITDFTMADIGGWKLGGPLTSDNPNTGLPEGKACNALVGVVRDFKGANEDGGHPDFESFEGDEPTKGLVAAMLGADHKPVYASKCEASNDGPPTCPFGQMTTSKKDFDEWYRFTDGVNKPYLIYFQFQPGASGLPTFSSDHFFPLDGAGWGNSGMDAEMRERNFGFTTEFHTTFRYAGGEKFTFTGDDDLWVFINGKLAMDLGGLHPEATDTLDLDAAAPMLGLEKDKVYPMDLFHAERHTDASNFHIETDFAFVDCGTIIK